MFYKYILFVIVLILPMSGLTQTDLIQSKDFESEYWEVIEKNSRHQTVRFFAWGGDPAINKYLEWVSLQLKEKYGITFKHVKINSTEDAVALMLSEDLTKLQTYGSHVDLIWINGKNFELLKENNLLLENWIARLPNYIWLNVPSRTFLTKDFGLDTQGSEMPWGLANLSFYYNSRKVSEKALPQNAEELLQFAQVNPGRFTYPAPPDFLGVSFLKQTLSMLADNPKFYQAVNPDEFSQLTAALWAYLDALHPMLYLEGQYFSNSQNALLRLFDDEILLMGITFNQANLQGMKKRYDLPEYTQFFTMNAGSLSNIHFVAISKFSKNKDAALVSANFLLSPKAQGHKAHMMNWGDKTVLDVEFFASPLSAYFAESELYSINEKNINPLSEFHPSWDKALSDEWIKRYHN